MTLRTTRVPHPDLPAAADGVDVDALSSTRYRRLRSRQEEIPPVLNIDPSPPPVAVAAAAATTKTLSVCSLLIPHTQPQELHSVFIGCWVLKGTRWTSRRRLGAPVWPSDAPHVGVRKSQGRFWRLTQMKLQVFFLRPKEM